MGEGDVTDIPENELTWKFVRASGPGGQNVNKVASRAILTWDLPASNAVPDDVKVRLALQQKRYFTAEGLLVVSSQRFRDQERNRRDCLDKLQALIRQAREVPKPRKMTRPTRGSQRKRLEAKKRRSAVKQGRRLPPDG